LENLITSSILLKLSGFAPLSSDRILVTIHRFKEHSSYTGHFDAALDFFTNDYRAQILFHSKNMLMADFLRINNKIGECLIFTRQIRPDRIISLKFL